jgi:amidohydrolase
MFAKSNLKESVLAEVDKILPRLVEMSDWIGNHPELGSEEYESSKLLIDELERHGFEVERKLLGMETAFRATYMGKPGGPRVAFLAEYDALPGAGHGCGHNIIGTAGIGAGIAVSKLISNLAGEVVVLGTPAEEGHGPSAGAKRQMVEAGVFGNIDVAMMIHPTSGVTSLSMGFLAISGVHIVFKGKSSHAAASPHEGVNALNAAVLTFMAVHANRQQLRRDANPVIHGIITEGGLASNIIPDRAALSFGVRSSDDSYIPELIRMVENSARGAALATGCEVEITTSTGLKSNIRNGPLEQLFYRIFKELGEDVEDPVITAAKPPGGSTDFADVTHVVPGIHPMVAIATKDVVSHNYEFAKATFTERGHRGLEMGAKAMAAAGIELLVDQEILEEIKKAHKKD